MKRRIVIVCCVFSALFCSSWGYLVHRTTTQLAVYQLPKSLQPLFHMNIEALVKASVWPDERRKQDSTEAPKHFIDLEMYEVAGAEIPQNWNSAVANYSIDTLEKYGSLPYVIIAVQEKLTAAFRSGNRDSILHYAADLAHYIGDAHVPLHTTINYDGQLTNQKGLHSLWESTIPELELKGYNLYARNRARYVRNKEERIWSAVRGAQALLPQLFLQEREATKAFADSTKFRTQVRNGKETKTYTAAFARAYSRQLGNTINRQLLHTSRMIADFWYTAWVDADRPPVTNILKTAYTAAEKEALKREVQSYRNNNLLRDSLLLARKKADAEK